MCLLAARGPNRVGGDILRIVMHMCESWRVIQECESRYRQQQQQQQQQQQLEAAAAVGGGLATSFCLSAASEQVLRCQRVYISMALLVLGRRVRSVPLQQLGLKMLSLWNSRNALPQGVVINLAKLSLTQQLPVAPSQSHSSQLSSDLRSALSVLRGNGGGGGAGGRSSVGGAGSSSGTPVSSLSYGVGQLLWSISPARFLSFASSPVNSSTPTVTVAAHSHDNSLSNNNTGDFGSGSSSNDNDVAANDMAALLSDGQGGISAESLMKLIIRTVLATHSLVSIADIAQVL
jgi:hypothetical protein